VERLESYHGVRKDISIRAFGRENIRFRGRTEIGFKFESREFKKYEVVHEQSYIKNIVILTAVVFYVNQSLI